MSTLNPIDLNAPLVKLTPTAGANSSAAMVVGYGQVVVSNAGPNMVFMKSSGATSTTAVVDEGAPVFAGAIMTFSVDPNHASIAAICPSGGSATVYIQTGNGE